MGWAEELFKNDRQRYADMVNKHRGREKSTWRMAPNDFDTETYTDMFMGKKITATEALAAKYADKDFAPKDSWIIQRPVDSFIYPAKRKATRCSELLWKRS